MSRSQDFQDTHQHTDVTEPLAAIDDIVAMSRRSLVPKQVIIMGLFGTDRDRDAINQLLPKLLEASVLDRPTVRAQTHPRLCSGSIEIPASYLLGRCAPFPPCHSCALVWRRCSQSWTSYAWTSPRRRSTWHRWSRRSTSAAYVPTLLSRVASLEVDLSRP